MAVSAYEGSVASAAAAQAYVVTAIRLPGGPPLAYWRLADTNTLLDEIGVRNGSWTTPGGALVSGLPRGSDGAVDFKGVATAEVPHDAGLALPAFTLSFWVKPNTVPAEEEPNYPLVSKDQAGITAGDFFVALVSGGGVLCRFQDGTNNHDIGTPDELMVAGQSYHLCVRASNTGFDLYVDGVLQGQSSGYTDAWSANSQPIRFADDPAFAADGDVVLDEVALYDRFLTEAEVIALSQRSDQPLAADDTASVPESATTEIDVLANDAFVGQRSNLTVTIVQQPSGGDSVAVTGNNGINYTAGAVTEDTERSFQYRITDPNGMSNTATARVIVLNAGAPAASDQANCYTENTTDTVTIGSGSGDIGAALESAINAAPPGRTILIAPGTYTGGTRTFDPGGTIANPIVVRPQSGIGTVTINSPTWTLANGSSRLVLSKLYFTDAGITINGSRQRIARCRFRNINGRLFRDLEIGRAANHLIQQHGDEAQQRRQDL